MKSSAYRYFLLYRVRSLCTVTTCILAQKSYAFVRYVRRYFFLKFPVWAKTLRHTRKCHSAWFCCTKSIIDWTSDWLATVRSVCVWTENRVDIDLRSDMDLSSAVHSVKMRLTLTWNRSITQSLIVQWADSYRRRVCSGSFDRWTHLPKCPRPQVARWPIWLSSVAPLKAGFPANATNVRHVRVASSSQ